MGTHYCSDMVNRRTALYRFYDAAGRLLYVGISLNMPGRLAKHRLRPWWPEVDDITVRWFGGREAAKAAEKVAIRDEAPVYNITRPVVMQWREVDQ